MIEADESDGTLVRYAPAIGVILNLQRDHREMTEVASMFAVLRARAREALVVGEDANLDALAGGALRFGFGPAADIRGLDVELAPRRQHLPCRATSPSRCRCPGGTMS